MKRKAIEWSKLDTDYQKILSDYLEEMEPIMGMNEVIFSERECSSCGEVGFVPEHHRFLCVFCYVCAPFLVENPTEPFTFGNYGARDSEGRGIDKVRINIPIGIEGVGIEPEVYSTTIYSSDEYSQEELQAMIS